jgi:hypothetical protein
LSRLNPFATGRPDGGSRCVLPVAPRPDQGLLSDHVAAAQPWRRERVFVPHSGRSALGQCSVKMNLLGQAAQRVQAAVFKT